MDRFGDHLVDERKRLENVLGPITHLEEKSIFLFLPLSWSYEMDASRALYDGSVFILTVKQ